VIDPFVDLKVFEQKPDLSDVKIPGQGLEEWLN
jgi:hypothetical protein